MESEALIRDDWLTDQLGKPAWRLESHAEVPTGKAWINAPAFIQTRTSATDPKRCRELFFAGFNLINTAISLGRIGPTQTPRNIFDVRLARKEDAPLVTKIAGRVFTFDRFHADPEIPNDIADRIKANWAENYFRGQRGEWMIVGYLNGRVAGFLQLLKKNSHVVIDLIGVDKQARGTGLAAKMIAYSTTVSQSQVPMKVGTQLTNTPSIRFYEALGFKIEAAYHEFHCHVS